MRMIVPSITSWIRKRWYEDDFNEYDDGFWDDEDLYDDYEDEEDQEAEWPD